MPLTCKTPIKRFCPKVGPYDGEGWITWSVERCGERYQHAREFPSDNNLCLNCESFETAAWLSVGG